MKNIIITTASIILIIIISSYQLYINGMIKSKLQLKFLADEAAATAALYVDYEKYSEGLFRFDKKEGEAAGKIILKLNSDDSDMKSYFEFHDSDEKCPSVKVTIKTKQFVVHSKYEYISEYLYY